MWYPTAKDILDLHFKLVELFASGPDPIYPAGQRDMNLLESACMRPRTQLGDVEKYRTVEQKAAALFHSLVKNHPFHNGNKRTGLASLITVLWRNDRRFGVRVTDDDLFDMVLNVSRNTFSEHRDADAIASELSAWIKYRTSSLTRKPRVMGIADFLDSCVRLGLLWKESGPSYVVYDRSHSIRVSRSTQRLDPPVVREYMNKLGLRDVTVVEFQLGIDNEQAEITRFRQVFRRLAHT
jgi:death-on-curing family protein